ncbi:unnamed protein product [Oncorhynchus mykiss]|uniref:SUN domain-containing protein n=1 Tax=Oncorhynchus mykiss TaxID=8022 RepID=A0A060YVT0_ONCMY|nr:unnamed protein product [Oncorhynchus mykiss]
MIPGIDYIIEYAQSSLCLSVCVCVGGSIVTSRCSETYKTGSARVSFLGIPLWSPSESPRTVIQGQLVQPGKCWPFRGAQGSMTVALSHPVHVTHVTMEHISTAVSPTGHIDSAPKDFAVYVSHL